jgi:hypothetical protein
MPTYLPPDAHPVLVEFHIASSGRNGVNGRLLAILSAFACALACFCFSLIAFCYCFIASFVFTATGCGTEDAFCNVANVRYGLIPRLVHRDLARLLFFCSVSFASLSAFFSAYSSSK